MKIRINLTAILLLASVLMADMPRERILFNSDWRFYRGDCDSAGYRFVYDADFDWGKANYNSDIPTVELKQWMLATGYTLMKDSNQTYLKPAGDVGADYPFVRLDYDDSQWQKLDLPHDWAIAGPFVTGAADGIGGGMGRLPSPGVGWYRKSFFVPESDSGKMVYLDIDGAMSYAAVWLNGQIVGGWPYGYASWRVNLTPYLRTGKTNLLAIRLDNPPDSSRWYPGGGIYRNVWLVKASPVHIAQCGSFIRSSNVSDESAKVEMEYEVENTSSHDAQVELCVNIFLLDASGVRACGQPESNLSLPPVAVKAGGKKKISIDTVISDPHLWGPSLQRKPELYVAEVSLWQDGKLADKYETRFGIRSIDFDPVNGLLVNGKKVYINGVNQHHDLGSLGSAFNVHAAQRQLEALREMGCNAIRMSHNPPAPELLELTDKMGFLVIDEIFDCWQRKKMENDFHVIFDDWSEQDLRAMIRRDRNHPSVIVWSVGNEVGEQYTGIDGAEVASRLCSIVRQEDSSRPTACAMNYAKPDMPLPAEFDIITLNYQGEGIRNAPAYAGLKGIATEPMYEKFHETFPDKMIFSSENAAAVSSRGEYIFPVCNGISSPVNDSAGGNSISAHVSSYELYTADFGSSADKVFAAQDSNPFVAGGFVWSGWDYLGEPTPYYQSRSSYFGIIDLAGFRKDRFYLYQSRWRPEMPIAHILPHWNWPDRIGQITPVHVFTSGDEAELFLNGVSQGRKVKGKYEYRLKWDYVVYQPGELKVIVYKNGRKWAEDSVKTTGCPAGLKMACDRKTISADGNDLAFISVSVVDTDGLVVPDADDLVKFEITGPAEIVSTDNGDPTDFMPFPSHIRKAFNGHCLVIIRSLTGESGAVTVTAQTDMPGRSKVKIKLKTEKQNLSM